MTLDSTSYHHGIHIRSNTHSATLHQQGRNRGWTTRESVSSHRNLGSISPSRREDPHLSSRQRLHPSKERHSRPIQRLQIPLRARPRWSRSSICREEMHRHRSSQQTYTSRKKQAKRWPSTILTPIHTTSHSGRICSSRILLQTRVPRYRIRIV